MILNNPKSEKGLRRRLRKELAKSFGRTLPGSELDQYSIVMGRSLFLMQQTYETVLDNFSVPEKIRERDFSTGVYARINL